MGLLFNAALFRTSIDRARLTPLVVVLAVLGLSASCASYALRGAVLMGDISGLYDPVILGLLAETPVGTALLLRCIGFGLILGVAYFPSLPQGLSVAAGLVILWSFTQIGHVFDLGSLLLQAVLLIHLVIVAFWIGILIPLGRLAKDIRTLDQAAQLGHEFGRMAAIAIPILLISGIALAYLLVGQPSGISTPYGLALLIKLVAVILLLILGAINKLFFVRKLRNGDKSAARHLTLSISGEWAVFCVIFAATAIITSIFTPPGF